MRSLLIYGLLILPSLAHADGLEDVLKSIEENISGRLGVAVLYTENDEIWHFNGGQRFPVMSTFKTLACAKLLYDSTNNGFDLTTETLVEADKLIFWSPVTKKLINKKITAESACEATMLTSDNTAANIVLDHIGGPDGVTAFLHLVGDEITRLDRIEPDLNEAKPGDLRDTTTPTAMVKTLNQLFFGNVLVPSSSSKIKNWMQENTISNALLRSVLPEGWMIADRTGAGGNGTRGITAIIWDGSRAPLILAIYMAETDLTLEQRNQAIAKIGKALFEQFNIVSS